MSTQFECDEFNHDTKMLKRIEKKGNCGDIAWLDKGAKTFAIFIRECIQNDVKDLKFRAKMLR